MCYEKKVIYYFIVIFKLFIFYFWRNFSRKGDSLGPEYLNLNPRALLVVFKQKDGTYVLTDKNDKGFIQSEGDEENPTLMDTLDEISIKNNILKINFNYV